MKNRKIVRAALLLLMGTILSKLLGFARELVVAYQFGAGAVSDAFLLTNSIPSMLFVSLATAVGINYIPVTAGIEDQKKRNEFTSNFMNICGIIMLIGCLVIEAFPRVILFFFASGLPEETEQYAIIMLRVVAFTIIPLIFANILQAYSQVNEVFYSTALFGSIANVVMILFTLISTKETFYLLSVGTVMANIAAMIMALFYAQKGGFVYYRKLDIHDESIKSLILLTVPLIAENLASDLSLIVDRNLASYLEEGTIASLGYAGTLGNIASTMISTSIITATFPVFSKMTADGQSEAFKESFNAYAMYLCYILAPISVFMLFMSEEIVTFIFIRGAFDKKAAQIVWESMAGYAIGVLPMGMQSYMIRGFYALKDTKTPVKIKVVSLLSNILLNFALVRGFKHFGIAVSTSISYYIAYFALVVVISSKYSLNCAKTITLELLKSLFIASVIVWFYKYIVADMESVFGRLLSVGCLTVMTYFIVIYMIKKSVRNEVKRILKK